MAGSIRNWIWLVLLREACAVKELYTQKDYRDLMTEAGGRPVIIDYYSQSCGPCHMIAPVFRRIAKQYAGRAYFRKVDVNRNRELAGMQQISSMPTFQFYMSGKKRHQFSGADEGQLAQLTRQLVDEADRNDVVVSYEDLEEFYKKHEPSKATKEGLDNILEKNRKNFGTMVKLLKKKYGEAPKTSPAPRKAKPEKKASADGGSKAGKPLSLKDVSLEDLKNEMDRREEDAADARVEQEDMQLQSNPCALFRKRKEGAIEKVVIIGGGPAGMTAAIYAARANLCPLLIAPAIGGQLLAKGVDVENYPGMPRENGGKMIQTFKQQAQSFFAEVRNDIVTKIDTSKRPSEPFELHTNGSGVVKTHTIIFATGADSRWLEVEGEWDLRGQGVSSCAACDGYLFRGRSCAVIGGGDTAMEEALMLSRICSSVVLIHRRDQFRASDVLIERVKANKAISIRYNAGVTSFIGKTQKNEETGEEVKALKSITLNSTVEDVPLETLDVDAAFVAIGHIPNTPLLKGLATMTASGYLVNPGKSTATSVGGLFTAGDVSDFVYRQAITSAGTGAMAALDAEKYLSEHPIANEDECVRIETFEGWSVKDLKEHVKSMKMQCKGCNEKSHYVDLLRNSFAVA